MTGCTPRSLASRILASTSGFGGSIIPTNPTKIRSLFSTLLYATPNTRNACSAKPSFCCTPTSFSFSPNG
ncbi:hypothetical protein, partial [Bacillus thuringiensis]|uniref:hypothetical protein n=1 Tax=Bacillus thuringiensis TaxID=1428 RepID=UPI0035C8D9A4